MYINRLNPIFLISVMDAGEIMFCSCIAKSDHDETIEFIISLRAQHQLTYIR